MKILKPGREQHGWAAEATCTGKGNGGGGCGALLLVEESDLYKTGKCHYDGSSERYTTFCCPSCRVETDLDMVPSAVESRLPWKSEWRGNETATD